jgi:hypothetical protein
LHRYHEDYGCFPAVAIADKNGKPLLSWRVSILPYLEEDALYSRFHLDEPWDSPHNRALIAAMPGAFRCPSDQARKPGMTNYQAIVGPAMAFTADLKPHSFDEFADGLSNTILVGESIRSVPWSKPEDLPSGAGDPLLGLSSNHDSGSAGFIVAFADSSVRFLKQSIPPAILKALLTRNGNEVISPGSY